MRLDEVLNRWALWSASKDDFGLGYAQSFLNRVDAPRSAKAQTALPYGVCSGELFSDVDRAIMALPVFMREVLLVRYLPWRYGKENGNQPWSVLGCSRATFFRYLDEAKLMLQLVLVNLPWAKLVFNV